MAGLYTRGGGGCQGREVMVKLMVGVGGGRMTTVYLSLTSPSSLSGGEGEGIVPPPPFWTISTRQTPILYPKLSFSPRVAFHSFSENCLQERSVYMCQIAYFRAGGEGGGRQKAHGRMRAFRNQHPGDMLTA